MKNRSILRGISILRKEAWDATTIGRRSIMERNRAAVAATQTTTKAIPGAKANLGPPGARRRPVRLAIRDSLGNAPEGDGLWERHDLLAATPTLAASRRVESIARNAALVTAGGQRHRLLACHRRFFPHPRRGGGKKVDRTQPIAAVRARNTTSSRMPKAFC